KKDNVIVGSGCYKENHITRVYVKPEYQRQGFGSYIMECLESEIALKYNNAYLDSSAPAYHLYQKRGYKTIK
ncbi:MAG: GNAT family N-acetyltransferase, partial [Firmicutes bacterium]|nr:GNAT family N-acetyltransferase [Bacillota bacterium]